MTCGPRAEAGAAEIVPGREHKKFRFGVISSAGTAEEWKETARRAEELGYSVLLSSDHLRGTHVSQFSPMISLTAAASVTTTIRLGICVLCQSFRHPAVLAREAATLDILSGGRLELGLGAGSDEEEHHLAGMPWGTAGMRVARTWECFDVVNGLLEGGSFEYHGKYFDIDGLAGEPRPVQQPRPPMMMGALKRLNLEESARRAEIVSTIGLTPAEMDKRAGWVWEAAGDRAEAIELNGMIIAATVTEGSRIDALRANPWTDLVRDMLAAEGHDSGDESLVSSPFVLAGSVSALTEELIVRRERWGTSYYVISSPDMDDFGPVVAQLRDR